MCIVHIFDFIEKPEYIGIATWGSGKVYAGPEFVHWLLDRGELKEVQYHESQEGDIILYFASGNVAHAGLVATDSRIDSKWGSGLFYQHEVFEVPAQYGEEIRYFRRLPYDTGYDLFCQYAEDRGIVFEE